LCEPIAAVRKKNNATKIDKPVATWPAQCVSRLKAVTLIPAAMTNATIYQTRLEPMATILIARIQSSIAVAVNSKAAEPSVVPTIVSSIKIHRLS